VPVSQTIPLAAQSAAGFPATGRLADGWDDTARRYGDPTMTGCPPPDALPEPRRVAPAELPAAALLPILDPDGQVAEPLVVVDLDAERGDLGAAADAARAADRVLVGVAGGALDPELVPLVRELDLTLVPAGLEIGLAAITGVPHPSASASALYAAATAHPHAVTVLARLLRWTGGLAVPAALDAESLAYSTLLGGAEFRRWLDSRGPRPAPPRAAAEPVLVQRSGDELRITLNRPERRNAYGREVRDALVAALQLAEWDTSIGRVVLDGAGPAFCSGGDLDEFGTTPDLVTAHLVRTRGGAALPLSRIAERVEVRLHGACVGAGIELPAFAGRVVAAPDTRIRLPELAMGVIPGAGGTVSISHRIGRWRTLYLALSGQEVDAPTALAWGLIDEIAGDG
jgi:enoyl-CoA hydratase/carnithine racemase